MNKRKTCAVYTRLSSEEAARREDNSLASQKQICLRYYEEKLADSFKLSVRVYEDAGFSGGSINRPALKELLQKIEIESISLVLIYKIDRLTRRLADFSVMLDKFERHGASFISVTQNFNSSTSVGRLTLNILLTFAQFERELMGDRIRDKKRSQRKRGLWLGGRPPIGYCVRDRRLVVDSVEARVVRKIFRSYADGVGVHQIAKSLNRGGCRTKTWTTRTGNQIGGRRFGDTSIRAILRNRIYAGAQTLGTEEPGEWYVPYPKIIDRDLWESVCARGEAAKLERADRENSLPILRGLIFDDAGNAMKHRSQGGGRRRYAYYKAEVPRSKNGVVLAGSIRNVRCDRIDDLVFRLVRQACATSTRDESDQCDDPSARHFIVDSVRRVILSARSVRVRIRDESNLNLNGLKLACSGTITETEHGFELISDHTLGPKPRKTQVYLGKDITCFTPTFELRLLEAVASGYQWRRWLEQKKSRTFHELLQKLDKVDMCVLQERISLSLLAPDIVTSIVEGRQPRGLTWEILMRAARRPKWSEQRRLIEFATGVTDVSD